jgi:hypothetical protein
MAEEHPDGAARRRREYWIAAAAVIAAVLVRSAVFVFWEQAHYDSDQAIVGLMAKHLVEGRAFPVFYYGQNYMLGVDAYLAAPFFLLAGPSVLTLKLPLLLINIGVALALLRMFVVDAGLRPYLALLPVLIFAVPAPVVAAALVAPNGGNLAPFMYAALIWLTRRRPVWCGLLAGIGFLHREFTIYAVLALFAVEAIDGTLWTREGVRRRLGMLRTAAEVWLVVHILKSYSSAAGPGTTLADLYTRGESVLAFASRFCTDPAMVPRGLSRLFTDHYPYLLGTQPMPLTDAGIETAMTQGFPGAWIVFLLTVIVAAAGVAAALLRERRWHAEYNPCAYLVLIGILSLAGYIVGRCGGLHFYTLRYDLLSLLALSGLAAWFLQTTATPRLRQGWLAIAAVACLITLVPNLRLLHEYLRHEPGNPKRMIIRHLEVRGIKYAVSDYWRSYALTFMANERIVIASEEIQRIREYATEVQAHKAETVRIAREYCPGGSMAMPRVWICPYQ